MLSYLRLVGVLYADVLNNITLILLDVWSRTDYSVQRIPGRPATNLNPPTDNFELGMTTVYLI